MGQTTGAGQRNLPVILSVLQGFWPGPKQVLEVASGTGQHGASYCEAQPQWIWQPTDGDPNALSSIKRYSESNKNNLLVPLLFDVQKQRPPFNADVILAINLIHISPWTTTLALLKHASEVGELVLYGPFLQAGVATAPSNTRFDQWLKERDAAFGIRDLTEVTEVAANVGLTKLTVVNMPANNLIVRFQCTAP